MQCLTGHNNNKMAINTGCIQDYVVIAQFTCHILLALLSFRTACLHANNNCKTIVTHKKRDGCVCASETRQKCRVCVLDFFLPTTLDSSEALTELLSAGKIIYLQTTSPSLSFHSYQSPSVRPQFIRPCPSSSHQPSRQALVNPPQNKFSRVFPQPLVEYRYVMHCIPPCTKYRTPNNVAFKCQPTTDQSKQLSIPSTHRYHH